MSLCRVLLVVPFLLAPATAQDAPAGEERAKWIEEQVREVAEGNELARRAAMAALLRNDQAGDCTIPLVTLLLDSKLETPRLVDLVRGLGRDRLLDAAGPIAKYLTHKESVVRGNAAVSLEYIGNRNKEIVAALLRAAEREKDEVIANHMYRALGRCGVGDAKARTTLLKKCGSARSEFATYGPTIGLAYFEGDAKAARGVEKILKRIGVPGGGMRGGAQNAVKRAVVSWTLAWIGDPKSGPFVREELIAKLENMKAFWVDGLRNFYASVARRCEGDRDAMAAIEAGVRVVVQFARGGDLERYGAETRTLMDECRKGREGAGFHPRGDYLLEAPAGQD